MSIRLWEGHIEDNGVSFSYTSPDGENGYPGEVSVTINYQLADDNKILISYVAKTTKATPINLTNHSYFNLGGHDSGSVTDHIVEIDADKYTPMVIETRLPSGEISSVDDTVFDLRSPTRIGDKINEVPGLGYDHNFCVKSSEKPCVIVTHKESGRKMEVSTTKPGIQFYTANYLNDSTVGKCGAIYPKHSALCLESQFYPNAVNQVNAESASATIADTVNSLATASPDAPIMVLGDFNHCRLENTLPNYHQVVDCATRGNNVLDRCYCSIRDAYKANVSKSLHELYDLNCLLVEQGNFANGQFGE
ncbi:aldose 1-epimerase-like [Strongylocentrotus purpuratus]|uniref:Galactose mutarotase n=1 Tax=Strongylocentrotus purpuratus TaxID=7668 RepID=A0A7M7PRT1_STRPU|nr:aldose 1-epimerase-like [Strongylocentrotus purpuratus]